MCVLLLSRCPAGAGWWYMGEKCERKGSTQENTVIAVASTISVFAVMLIVTVTTAVCLKKKYRQRKEQGESLSLEDVSILPLSANTHAHTHAHTYIYYLGIKELHWVLLIYQTPKSHFSVTPFSSPPTTVTALMAAYKEGKRVNKGAHFQFSTKWCFPLSGLVFHLLLYFLLQIQC